MTKKEKLMRLNGVKSLTKPKENQQTRTVYLSREDFNLLDVTDSNTIYYVSEINGMMTMIKGDNR